MDLAGEEEDRDSPISIPSARFNCKHQECYHSTLAEAGLAPRGTLVKAPSPKRAFRERSVRSGNRSQCGQSAPSRATDCVYPRSSITRSAFTLICLSTCFRYAGADACVTDDTKVNKTHRTWIVTDTHRELCWMTESWRRLPLTCFLVMTSHAPDISPSVGLITHMIQSWISLKTICLSVYLSICLSVCLSVIYLTIAMVK